MRFTILAWLTVLARLTIYGHRPVLSLPQSLIGNKASLRQHQSQVQSANSWQNIPFQRHRPWKKDSLFVDSGSGTRQLLPEDAQMPQSQSPEKNNNKKAANQETATENKAVKDFIFNGGRLANKYDLNTLLANTQSNEDPMPQFRAIKSNVPFTPLKYWTRFCQTDKNCPTVYYRNISADRKKAAALKQHWDGFKQADNGYYTAGYDDEFIDNADMSLAPYDGETSFTDYNQDNNDVFLMLTGEQDLKMFLNWAMAQLYSHNKFQNNRSLKADFADGDNSAADDYHSGMYLWRKSHLSGRLEPKMLVDEPNYILLGNHQWPQQISEENLPFIPPRGRKHDNLPDLGSLLNRYETFVPNRGKRDKIKDILKYDDLFYPNRGKKKSSSSSRTTTTTTMTSGCNGSTGNNRVCGDNHNDN